MYSELQLNPGWTDLDIFKITYDEYMAFSRRYMAGQVASNPRSTAPNSNASSTDLVALFTKSIVESKEKVAPKGIIDKDIGGDDAITAKGIKEIPSISSRLLAIPTTVLPSEGDTNGIFVNSILELALSERGSDAASTALQNAGALSELTNISKNEAVRPCSKVTPLFLRSSKSPMLPQQRPTLEPPLPSWPWLFIPMKICSIT
jgi:hypothetical protein